MKHNERKFNKIIKQITKCRKIKEVEKKGAKYLIKATSGEQYLFHMGEAGLHPLRRWLKKNSSVDLSV